MMSIPVQSYRKWAQILKKGGAQYAGQDAKGHHVWYYTPKGDTVAMPIAIAAHNDGADVLLCYITNIRRAWKLRSKDGVTDHVFMSGSWPKDNPPEDESSREKAAATPGT